MEEFKDVDPEHLIFLDESGASTALDRNYGRAPSGNRVEGPEPHGHWKIVTLTAAMRLSEIPKSACLAFDGATNSTCFETYVRECLVSTLRPGDVVMNNLACHKSTEVERLIRAAGAEVRLLPPYSPDLDPIEKMFGKLKWLLRSAAARTIKELIEAMGDALKKIQPSDILGWFNHCGYRQNASTAGINGKSV